jgi:AcrR family transcriptional regulator
MIYHYFDSKQKLYTTVLESMYAELRTREGSLEIDFDKPLEGLLKLLSFTFDYFEKNPSFEGILRAENVMRGRFVRRSARVSEMGFPLRRTITDLIASGQKQGILRHDLDAAQLYVTIAALSRFHHSSAFTLSAVLGTDISRPEWRKARWDHAQQMFIAYLISTGDVSALPAVAQEPDIAAKPTRKPRSAKAAQTAEPQAPALAAEPQT